MMGMSGRSFGGIRVGVTALALAALIGVGGCSSGQGGRSTSGGTSAAPVELHVLSAAALKAVLTSIAPAFEKKTGTKIVASYGSAGALQKQIEAGAPADVFLSASPKQVASLTVEALVSNEDTVTFASNDLVILVPGGNPSGVHSPGDLKRVDRLATGDPVVAPHGQKAQEWLVGLGLWDSLKPKFVFAQNAVQTDDYVARKEVDAAIGFASDATGRTDLEVAYTVPADQYKPIKYVAVPVKASAHGDLAKQFTEYMLTAPVQGTLTGAGFKAAPGK
jgi:molybdate transport system substrate-binding protein